MSVDPVRNFHIVNYTLNLPLKPSFNGISNGVEVDLGSQKVGKPLLLSFFTLSSRLDGILGGSDPSPFNYHAFLRFYGAS